MRPWWSSEVSPPTEAAKPWHCSRCREETWHLYGVGKHMGLCKECFKELAGGGKAVSLWSKVRKVLTVVTDLLLKGRNLGLWSKKKGADEWDSISRGRRR